MSTPQEEKKFDVAKFNKEFEMQKESEKEKIKQKEEEKLRELNKVQGKKKLYQLTLYDIAIGIKTSLFELLDDLLEQRWSIDILTKNDRLFFIGITIFIIAIILYIYNMLTEWDDNPKVVTETHHIYYRDANQTLPNPGSKSLLSSSDRA